MGETGELQVKPLWESVVLPMRGSAGAASYDLCATNSCIISSWGKGAIETNLAVSLPLGIYARIAPHSRFATSNFIDIGVGVLDSDYWGETKVVLFNYSTKNFTIQPGDWIA